MSLLANAIHGLRSLFRKRAIENEMDEELRGFVEASAAARQHIGMPAEQALRAARAEMGSTNAVKHRNRSGGWETRLESLALDLRHALRSLLRSPAFTLIAVVSLALGIGANTAIFTLVKQVILENLPVRNPQQLVAFGKSTGGGIMGGIDLGTNDMFTYDFARQLESSPGPFQGVASYSSFSPKVNVRVPNSPAAIQVPASLVSGNFFSVMQATPLLGRVVAPSTQTPPIAVP